MYGCPVPAFPNVTYDAPLLNLAFCFSTVGDTDSSYDRKKTRYKSYLYQLKFKCTTKKCFLYTIKKV